MYTSQLKSVYILQSGLNDRNPKVIGFGLPSPFPILQSSVSDEIYWSYTLGPRFHGRLLATKDHKCGETSGEGIISWLFYDIFTIIQ